MITPDEQSATKLADAAALSPERWVAITVGIMAILGGFWRTATWLLRPVAQLRTDHDALAKMVGQMTAEQLEREARRDAQVEQIADDVAVLQKHMNIIPSIERDVSAVKLDVAVMAADSKSAKETAERTEIAVDKIGDNMLKIATDLGEVKGAMGRTRSTLGGSPP